MAPKLSDEKKSHMVTIRMDRSMKANLDEAASENGRSLSGEIQHRLAAINRLGLLLSPGVRRLSWARWG